LITTKQCYGFCKQIKPVANFYSKGEGLDSFCKDCRKKQKRKQYRTKRKDINFEVVSVGKCDRRFLAKGIADLIVSIVRGNGQFDDKEENRSELQSRVG